MGRIIPPYLEPKEEKENKTGQQKLVIFFTEQQGLLSRH